MTRAHDEQTTLNFKKWLASIWAQYQSRNEGNQIVIYQEVNLSDSWRKIGKNEKRNSKIRKSYKSIASVFPLRMKAERVDRRGNTDKHGESSSFLLLNYFAVCAPVVLQAKWKRVRGTDCRFFSALLLFWSLFFPLCRLSQVDPLIWVICVWISVFGGRVVISKLSSLNSYI